MRAKKSAQLRDELQAEKTGHCTVNGVRPHL